MLQRGRRREARVGGDAQFAVEEIRAGLPGEGRCFVAGQTQFLRQLTQVVHAVRGVGRKRDEARTIHAIPAVNIGA